MEPYLGLCAEEEEPAWDPLSLPLSLKINLKPTTNKTAKGDLSLGHLLAYLPLLSIKTDAHTSINRTIP